MRLRPFSFRNSGGTEKAVPSPCHPNFCSTSSVQQYLQGAALQRGYYSTVVAWGAMAMEGDRCESRGRGVQGCILHSGCQMFLLLADASFIVCSILLVLIYCCVVPPLGT